MRIRKLTLEQRQEVRDRCKAGESQMDVAAAMGVHKKTIWRVVHEVPAPPKPEPSPTMRIEPQCVWNTKTIIQRGGNVVTREASVMQKRSDGSFVAVLRCPVYRPSWMAPVREDVEVLEMTGRRGRGRYTSLSGDVIHGDLTFYLTGREVTRVEFHPD